MNKNTNCFIVDIKDLVLFIFKKIYLVIIAGVIIAIAFAGYKYFSSIKKQKAIENLNVDKILDTTLKLPSESDEEYLDRVKNVNHAFDLIESIDSLNYLIENNREYVSDSIYMQIDPSNEAVSSASIIVCVESNKNIGSSMSLISTYKQYILSGEYLDSVSDELNINQSYLLELINATSENPSMLIDINGDLNNYGVINISVIGPNIEFTDKILNEILESINSLSLELNHFMISHDISIASRQSFLKVDNNTRDRQINITNRFESLQQQINSYDNALESIAKKIGIEKSYLYTFYSNNGFRIESQFDSSVSGILKFAIIGFVLGALIGIAIVLFTYLYNRKFSTQALFFCRFSWVKKIGVNRPIKKHCRYIRFLDVISGDDTTLSDECCNRLLAANINNLTSGFNKIMLTGTAEKDRIKDLVKNLNIEICVMDSFFTNPDVLTSISNFDGIILVEQRNYSDSKLIEFELDLISNSNIKLIGAIIL